VIKLRNILNEIRISKLVTSLDQIKVGQTYNYYTIFGQKWLKLKIIKKNNTGFIYDITESREREEYSDFKNFEASIKEKRIEFI